MNPTMTPRKSAKTDPTIKCLTLQVGDEKAHVAPDGRDAGRPHLQVSYGFYTGIRATPAGCSRADELAMALEALRAAAERGVEVRLDSTPRDDAASAALAFCFAWFQTGSVELARAALEKHGLELAEHPILDAFREVSGEAVPL